MKFYICIDIGGTSIKYGIVREDAALLESHEMPTEAQLGGPGILQKVTSIIEGYRKTILPAGVCISTAGVVDWKTGRIVHAADTIPNFKGTTFKTMVEETFGLPCEVENDVNCAALAEHYAGAAKGTSSSLCLTIGTGIGGAMILNNRIYHGFSFSGCEVGYMHMLGSTFQELGASSTLVKKVQQMKGDTSEAIDGRYVFNRAKEGDRDCIRAIDEMTDVLGMGIANICYIMNPEIVVLGGGIMAQQEYLYPKIRAAMDRYLIPYIREKTTLAFAQNQNQAGMLGSFYHFRTTRTQAE